MQHLISSGAGPEAALTPLPWQLQQRRDRAKQLTRVLRESDCSSRRVLICSEMTPKASTPAQARPPTTLHGLFITCRQEKFGATSHTLHACGEYTDARTVLLVLAGAQLHAEPQHVFIVLYCLLSKRGVLIGRCARGAYSGTDAARAGADPKRLLNSELTQSVDSAFRLRFGEGCGSASVRSSSAMDRHCVLRRWGPCARHACAKLAVRFACKSSVAGAALCSCICKPGSRAGCVRTAWPPLTAG